MSYRKNFWNRRRFLQTAGGITALGVTSSRRLAAAGTAVTIVTDPADTIASSAPCTWALRELERAFEQAEIPVTHADNISRAAAGNLCIAIAGSNSAVAQGLLGKAGATVPSVPEALAIVSAATGPSKVTLASGYDVRGIMYAILELADRVSLSENVLDSLQFASPILERPANKVRSVNRCFQSELEDRPWFEDKQMWPAYLTMLASHRFNMFNLSMGLTYDYPQKVSDSYTYFTYPFFVKVAGYDQVRAGDLTDEQREKNLDILRLISSECSARALDFTLGLWNHAYVMSPGSTPTYPITGLTDATHAAYCQDALYTLLKECPGITGLTMRVHGESGIPEGNFEFWQTVFAGISRLDRKITLNLHAKGTSQRIIDIAQSTNMPVSLSPKYWAEHLGLPYQPASIRELEKPPKEPAHAGTLFELSNGARKFMRYSYGDLFKKNRSYDVYFRIWPGTQRVLLWGDPQLAAGDGRGFSMCGNLGVDLFEPLSFKGRAGSGVSSAPAGRCSYADQSLAPRYDWEKFAYSYRVWGRHIYNPDADPEACHRYWNKQLRAASQPITRALALASRILRIVTTSQEPSAANWTYWPEMYTNMTIVDASLNTIYHDTPEPRVYGNVSPLDPQTFSGINETVDNLLSGQSNSRYSPLEVAQWLATYADEVDRNLEKAGRQVMNAASPLYRRVVLDVQIQSGLGRFFSAKIRSAALFAVYRKTGDPSVLDKAVAQYRKASQSWKTLASTAKGRYMDDVTYGKVPNMRGNWMDRLAAIEADIQAMQSAKPETVTTPIDPSVKEAVIRQIFAPSARPHSNCLHTPASTFESGSPLPIQIKIDGTVSAVRLVYRHVNQAEYYETVEMKRSGDAFRAQIPAGYSRSEYALQYYFELQHTPSVATLFPGIGPDLVDRPYFLVEQA